MTQLAQLRKELKLIADPQKAKDLQRFFKTGIGEYGEGDIFLGITVPKLREIAKKYYSLDIRQLKELIKSKIHEERMLALFVLINKYNTTNHKKICFHFYIKHMEYINNWDLVDLSAPNIVGQHLFLNRGPAASFPATPVKQANSFVRSASAPYSLRSKVRTVGSPSSGVTPSLDELTKRPFRGLPRSISILFNLAKSKNIWERRIAVLATFWFIKNNQFNDSLHLAKILLKDKHDLIHKAVGWMLREIGKRDLKTEIKFLNEHYQQMPRTMLRYAIEKFPKRVREYWLKH